MTMSKMKRAIEELQALGWELSNKNLIKLVKRRAENKKKKEEVSSHRLLSSHNPHKTHKKLQ